MEKVTTKKFILALIIITLASFVFNARLFIPKSAMITTPEFEITDAIQSSFAPKYWYWQKLYHRELPLWSSENAMGYPMLGEGIIGAFFLPNIILYGLSSSPPISYNLSIVLSFMITALGTYWWLLALSLPWGIAVANSLIFAGSGFFLFHQQHIIVIQAFSLMPWIFGTTHLLAKKKKVLYIPLLAILLSQQYFSGFYQAVCITGVAISLYMILVSSQLRDKNKLLFFFFLSCVLALVLSGIQLVPNIEYFRSVAESQSSNLFSTLFSYPLKNLLTFIHPFILGSPKDGSYFKNITESGDLFWESNGYVGLIPIIFAVTGFFIKQVRKNINTFGIILMIAVILMLGKNSPFYFIFDFPPFSFFRVPARYTVIVSFMIVSMSALTTAHIMKIRKHPLYRTIVYFSLGAAVFTLFAFWYPYHDVKSITDVIDVPNSVKTIPKDTALYLYAPTINHRKIFFSEGWLHPKKYDIFKNAIRSQTNVFWGISSFNIYSARTIKWLQYADNIITEGMDTTS